MDTSGLRLFVLAAERLNISAAGGELGFGPAVASARLAKLEQALGAELLHRTTRKVSLSQQGAEFLPYAQEILAQEDAAHAALGNGQLKATGTLRFASSSTFAQLYIAPILPEFLERHPELTLDLRLSDSLFDLIEGSFDLALRSSSLSDSSLKARKLAPDRRILCAAPQYLAEHGTPQDPSDLAEHELMSFRNGKSRTLIHESGNRINLEHLVRAPRIIVDDGHAQKLTTLAGAGISINSLWSVHRELREGSLVQVLPQYSLDDRVALWLIYPQSNVLTAKVRLFIDFLLEKIGKNPPWL